MRISVLLAGSGRGPEPDRVLHAPDASAAFEGPADVQAGDDDPGTVAS